MKNSNDSYKNHDSFIVGKVDRSSLEEKFGTRYLVDIEKAFEHNAWDHVDWGVEHEEYAKECIARQRNVPVGPQEREQVMNNPAGFWNTFYSNCTSKFFKDRHWIQREFPELLICTAEMAGEKYIVEVGCGAGNTVLPLLSINRNPKLVIHGVDFSNVAVSVLRSNELFVQHEVNARLSLWDLANIHGILPEGVEENSVDIVTLIFVFSALAPEEWKRAIDNIYKMLRPGGLVLFRDYGRFDMTQLRFKEHRLLQDNFYIRGDKTRVYFFEAEQVAKEFGRRFSIVQNTVDKRLLVNRKRELKMYRAWVQGKFLKEETGIQEGSGP